MGSVEIVADTGEPIPMYKRGIYFDGDSTV